MLAVIALSLLINWCAGTPLTAVWLSPIAPVAPLGQYQTQDGLASGGYHYAYSGPHHSKVETRLGGTIQGGYSYIDANGILQTVAYTADGSNGFQVHASNLPENVERQEQQESSSSSSFKSDRGEESEGKVDTKPRIDESLKNNRVANPFVFSKIQADKISKDIPKLISINSSKKSSPFDVPIDNNDLRNRKPISIGIGHGHESGEIVPRYYYPVLPYRLMHSSVHHTQDSLGQYDYSYTGDTSSKTESRSIDGTTRGAYSYVDPNGLLQQVHYIADENGFRVAATNLPEA